MRGGMLSNASILARTKACNKKRGATPAESSEGAPHKLTRRHISPARRIHVGNDQLHDDYSTAL